MTAAKRYADVALIADLDPRRLISMAGSAGPVHVQGQPWGRRPRAGSLSSRSTPRRQRPGRRSRRQRREFVTNQQTPSSRCVRHRPGIRAPRRRSAVGVARLAAQMSRASGGVGGAVGGRAVRVSRELSRCRRVEVVSLDVAVLCRTVPHAVAPVTGDCGPRAGGFRRRLRRAASARKHAACARAHASRCLDHTARSARTPPPQARDR